MAPAKIVPIRRGREGRKLDLEMDLVEATIDRPADDQPMERPCLCCKKLFPSGGWNNRLCNNCKRRDGPSFF